MHIRKSIALVVSESELYNSKNLLRSQKENQIFIRSFKNPDLNSKKKRMSDPLRTIILFIGYQFTVNEVGH